jgi:hypothetical protein
VFSKKHGAAAKELKNTFDAAALDQLGLFVLRADAKQWKGAFLENRGNLARYTRLLRYYEALCQGIALP